MQDLKGLGADLGRRTSAPAASDPSTPAPSAAVRAAALSAPTAAASPASASAAAAAAAAAKAAAASASRAADADVDRPLTPALASASPRLDMSRAAAPVPEVPDSASTGGHCLLPLLSHRCGAHMMFAPATKYKFIPI